MKIKMHMGCWDELMERLVDKISDKIKNKYDDDVYEFEITISNVKNITEEVGINKNGFRSFYGVEIELEEDDE